MGRKRGSFVLGGVATGSVPVKRGRGRPRKVVSAGSETVCSEAVTQVEQADTVSGEADTQVNKRSKGFDWECEMVNEDGDECLPGELAKPIVDLKSRCWVWTLNNYTTEEVSNLHSLGEERLDAGIRHLMWKPEVGKKKGTPHLQGHIIFNNQHYFGPVRKMLGGRVWIKPMRGSPKQSSNYIEKDDTSAGAVCQYGILPAQGRVSVLDEIYDMIKSGDLRTEHSVVEKYGALIMARFNQCIMRWLNGTNSKGARSSAPQVYCLWGDSDVGKSTLCRQWASEWTGGNMDDVFFFSLNSDKAWWDGYRGQTVVILNEMSGSAMSLTHFNQLCDADPYKVNVKGYQVEFNSPYILFTANASPRNWWSDKFDKSPVLRKAVIRRFNRIFMVSGSSFEDAKVGDCTLWERNAAGSLGSRSVTIDDPCFKHVEHNMVSAAGSKLCKIPAATSCTELVVFDAGGDMSKRELNNVQDIEPKEEFTSNIKLSRADATVLDLRFRIKELEARLAKMEDGCVPGVKVCVDEKTDGRAANMQCMDARPDMSPSRLEYVSNLVVPKERYDPGPDSEWELYDIVDPDDPSRVLFKGQRRRVRADSHA
jgi:hypothetical protein